MPGSSWPVEVNAELKVIVKRWGRTELMPLQVPPLRNQQHRPQWDLPLAHPRIPQDVPGSNLAYP